MKNEFPPGWDEERVLDVLEYYENQTEDEAVAEHEAAPPVQTARVPVRYNESRRQRQ